MRLIRITSYSITGNFAEKTKATGLTGGLRVQLGPMAATKAAGWTVIGDEDDETEEGDDAALASRYPSGRPIKCGNFVIGGYTPTTSSRPFRSLVLGLPAKEGLKHVGNVGVGFKLNSLPELYNKLQAIRSGESPFEQAML